MLKLYQHPAPSAGAAKRAGKSPRIFVNGGGSMAGTLSAFFDESGQEMKLEPDTKYYLLTVVLHDQGRSTRRCP